MEKLYKDGVLQIVNASVCRSVPLIDCNTIISSVMSTFEEDHRKAVLGQTYIDILKKYISSHKKNWGDIKINCWIGM